MIVGLQLYRDQFGAINAGVQSLGPTTDPPPSWVRDALRIGNRFNNTAGMMGEFLAAAVWPRPLTDTEVALASEALAGKPRMEDRRSTAVREIGPVIETVVIPVGETTVVEVRPPQSPDVTPGETWTRTELLGYLAALGVTGVDLPTMSDDELLDLIRDLGDLP